MERLVDTSLTATLFDPEAASRALPPTARTVVIGGGIMGASTAYHLAAAGDQDVVLVEANQLGSGTTWHAAGLCSSLRSSAALTDLARYGISEYARLEEASGLDVNFTQCGALLLARTAERLQELRYTAGIARLKGIPAELLTPDEVVQRWPLASTEELTGALWQPEDGHVNPGYACLAYAKLAHELGVQLVEATRVTRILHDNGRVVGVETERGVIACERVVLTGGLWSRDLAKESGVALPLYAAEHVHVRTEEVHGAHEGLAVLRDMDGYLYVRHENGRLLVGAFEPDGIPRSTEGIPEDGFAQFPPAWDHFAPVRGMAEQRVPVLKDTEFQRFLNAPESFTPDSNFLLGETAEIQQLWVAAGFNSQGIIYGPGVGRALQVWMDTGSPDFDASAVDVQRCAKQQNNRRFLHERTREGLGNLYAMHWPHKQPVTARNVRRSPLHQRIAAAGACFGEQSGWERPDFYGTHTTQPRYEYSFGKQNWFDAVGEEHRAAREAVALFDLSSFTKVEVAGPDALTVLQQVFTANLDMQVGRVRYTLALDANGRIQLDGTVVRLGKDRFWIITPAAYQSKTLGLLRQASRGTAAAVFDATSGYATLGLMGPESRELLSRISPDDVSDEALPYQYARTLEVADGHALALRVSYVGELGYELYVSADEAVNVYDAVVAAGEELGLRHAGYLALDSLRTEKGYRHLGHDIGPADNPFETGLGFTLSWKKEAHFTGRTALEVFKAAGPAPVKMVHVLLEAPDVVLVHDEAVVLGGRIVGRLTSGSYGYTLGAACGLASVEASVPDGAVVTVDCAGTQVPARVSARAFYDPDSERMRG